MNGVHDMGGMHGFGPIERGEKEPVFHSAWESRVFGMAICLGSQGVYDPVGLRFGLEEIEPATYLASSYFERWLLATEKALLEKGALTAEELDAKMEFFRENSDAAPPRKEDPAVRERLVNMLYTYKSPHRDVGVAPRFRVGDHVQVNNVHVQGHTRLPRYVRDKRALIVRFYGVDDFHDTIPEGSEAEPQPVYNVRFEARELWGESAEANESLYIDMYESYLNPA